MSEKFFDRIDARMNSIDEREMVTRRLPAYRMKRVIFRAGARAAIMEIGIEQCSLCQSQGLPVKIMIGDTPRFVHTRLTQSEVDEMPNHNNYSTWSMECRSNDVFLKLDRYDVDFSNKAVQEEEDDDLRDQIKGRKKKAVKKKAAAKKAAKKRPRR